MFKSRSLAAAGIAFVCAGSCTAQCSSHAVLNNWERRQFVQVATGSRAEVSAQFLSESGCGEQMIDALKRLGAKIDFADKMSGYVLATISKDKLFDALDLLGIAQAYTRDDERIYYQDPATKISQSERKPELVPQIEIPYPRVAKTLPLDGPYFATDEIGLNYLRRLHPEADGRGIRVAVPDEGFDLLHPALQLARDAAGKTVPKIADFGTLAGPDEDGGWVRFGDPIQANNGSFDAVGRTWMVPKDGTYRFGIFKTDLELGPEDNSKTKKLSLSVGVLWDQQSGHVWIDTNGNGSFKNQRALSDYGVTHDIDWFGAKDGDDDNRIPFGVKIDTARTAIYIRIGGNHGGFVAGPLAANKLTGGLFDGAAPSAQLIDEGVVNRAYLIAGMAKMFSRPDVDVINRSGGIARSFAPSDLFYYGAEDFAQHVLERLITIYDKPFVAYSSAIGTIFVNDYAGPEMLRRNRQLAPPYRDTINSNVFDLSNGWVNTVLAPSANLETESRYDPLDILWPDGKKHTFADNAFDPPAPNGYVIGANNSPAIPVVSGVLADLISEARREHVRYNVTRLNNALFTGARLLEGFPLSQQGYGLINAANSWNQLAKMANADDPANKELTSFTVSRMEDGHSVEVQGFHADLPNCGEKLDGEIWITRHGGYAAGRKYAFSLRGNDGSYKLLDHEATLERDKPVRVHFQTNGVSGWNIVFLELRDVAADVVMQDVALSVHVPDVPERIAPGVDKYRSTIPPLRTEHKYVRVGEEVQAARYMMQIPYTGPCCSTRSFPGSRYREGVTPPGEPVDASHHVGPMEALESLVVNDTPGMQEIIWENRGRSEYATEYDGPPPDVPIHAELAVSKYAVSLEKGATDTLTINNKLAGIDGRTELYDAMLKTQSLTGTGMHAMGELEATLPAHLAEWRLRMTPSGPSDGIADVYLLNCTRTNGCYVAAEQEISTASKTLAIDKPSAGAWKIVVRSRNQVQHPVKYAVREALLTPAATPIEATDSQHEHGATWTLPLPTKQNDAQYASFRIAGTPGVVREKNGLVIAMTPLDGDAP